MGQFRKAVCTLHLWLGLALGGLMVLAGLTGALLVFYTGIDAGLHPQQAATGIATLASYDRAAETLHRVFPDKPGPWRLEVTERAGAIPARYYNPPETSGHAHAPMMVWLSPDGTRVLRRDYWGQYAMTWIYDLHYQLQLDKAGGTLFGYAGIALALLLISGLWAWWPRGSWAKALHVKPRAAPVRRLRDLHKVAGLAGLPLLLMLTVTGVMLALPDETRQVLEPVWGKTTPLPELAHVPIRTAGQMAMVTPSEAVVIAASAMPAAQPAWIELPGISGGLYKLRMRQSADPSFRFPHSFIWIDAHSGTVSALIDAGRAGATDTILNWLHPLHDGSIGGLPLRIVVLLSGFIPLLLFVTGVMRWQARRLGRKGPR